MERGFGTCNGVDHHVSSVNNRAWLIGASVSIWVTMRGGAGTLGSGREFTLESGGVHTLGRDEGSLPISGGGWSGGVSGV